MVTVREVPADEFILKLKEELKKIKEIETPTWTMFVKSGAHKERPPEQEDFWYVRAAAVLRKIYLEGPVGVQRLRTCFGGRRRGGHAPAHFYKSSGSIIRKILQQLEKAGLIEKKKDKRGREITSKGRSFMNKVAYEVSE